MNALWYEIDVSTIHLANGQTVEAEVNGKDWEGANGWVFVQGREIEVERIDRTNEWEEDCA